VAALNFPNSPSLGQTYTANGSSWQWDGTSWLAANSGGGGGGATGGGTDQVFVENDQVVTTDYTIPSTKNAMTTGPITVDDGVSVTVSDGARWIIL
jgi:hypothetical protein